MSITNLSVSDPTLNKKDPPIELPSLWGTRVQAERLLMTMSS